MPSGFAYFRVVDVTQSVDGHDDGSNMLDVILPAGTTGTTFGRSQRGCVLQCLSNCQMGEVLVNLLVVNL